MDQLILESRPPGLSPGLDSTLNQARPDRIWNKHDTVMVFHWGVLANKFILEAPNPRRDTRVSRLLFQVCPGLDGRALCQQLQVFHYNKLFYVTIKSTKNERSPSPSKSPSYENISLTIKILWHKQREWQLGKLNQFHKKIISLRKLVFDFDIKWCM